MSAISRQIGSMILAMLVVAACVPSMSAQSRLSDKDIEHMMNNLKDDAKNFRPVFDRAIGKSTIRQTTPAKDARALAQSFQNQTAGMLRQFQSTKKADTSLPVVVQTASQIEKVKSDVGLGPMVDSQWAKIRAELDAISQAFNPPAN